MNRSIHVFILGMTVILAGCSFLQPVKTPVITHYTIHAAPKIYVRHSNKTISLLVNHPVVNPVFDTRDILYSDQPRVVNRYAVSRWEKKPSQMMGPLMLHSLDQSRYFRAVVTPPFSGVAQYELSTQILCLQQVFQHPGPQVKLLAKAQLVNHKTGEVVRSHSFHIAQKMRYCSVQSGVLATHLAVEKYLKQLVSFTVRAVESDLKE